MLEQRQVRSALKGAAESESAPAEGFAAALQLCQQAVYLPESTLGFALRPSIVRPVSLRLQRAGQHKHWAECAG